jgi:uncharacterized protein YcaQ
MQTISLATARRIALAAQGFGTARPTGKVDRRHVRRLFASVGVVQIDSVNVVVRSQELPLWARLGAHRRDLLTGMTDDGELFEYWAHMASLVPVALHPLLRWRMERAKEGHAWGGLTMLAQDQPHYIEDIYELVRERGPIAASELATPRMKSRPWWDWSDPKLALEYLFWCGRISARRRSNFERAYDLTERMIPALVLAQPTPSETDAQRALLELGARRVGIGTTRDIADYYRLKIPPSRPLITDLVDDGALIKVAVEGWREPAYLHRNARIPRRIDAATLLSPFDSVVWERSRNERLFDFHYRIEIYTPAPKRIYGYYVLPFLLGDRIVARVDVKADRHASTLLVHGAFAEEGVEPAAIAEPLARELHALAAWLGLDRVVVGRRGDVARPLAKAVASKAVATESNESGGPCV